MKQDLIKFYELLCQRLDGKITESEMYNQIYNLEANHHILNYEKAVAAYQNGQNLEAEIHIKKAIKFLNNGIELSTEELIHIIAENGLNNGELLFINNRVREEKIYHLAGEICSINGKYEEALSYYQKYQYYNELHLENKLKEKHDIVVYSFRRYNEYSLSDIINNEITVSPSSFMNDPFDSIANIWSKTSWLEKISKEKQHIPMFSKSFDFYRIRSFIANTDTYETDDNILKHILMWSFYAGEHKGFCVKYRLSQHFIKKEENDDYAHLRILPIEYTEKVQLEPQTKITTQSAYGVKHIAWKDEREVRLLSYNPTTDKKFIGEKLDSNSKIEEVIFGILCSSEQKRTIYNLISKTYDYCVDFYEMSNNPQNDIYELIKIPYKP